MEPDDSSNDTSSSTGHEEWEKAPKGHRGLFVPKKKVQTDELREKVNLAKQDVQNQIDPAKLGIPPEAQALFLKMSQEAMAQGSTLGSMRYLLGQLESLTCKVRSTVAALETAERQQITPPAEAAT